MGTMHGYALARRIEQVCGDSLELKFYSLTKAGRKQLRVEVANWEKATALVARFLEASS